MNLFPFLVLGLLNGMLVGLTAALVARGLAPGSDSLRFRDAAFLGMSGSVVGNIVATIINSQDNYLANGPSSLLFSVVGAALAIGAVSLAHSSSRPAHSSQSFGSNQS